MNVLKGKLPILLVNVKILMKNLKTMNLILKENKLFWRDEGERVVSYIFQKLLGTHKQPTTPQRHSLFRNRCIVQQKVCDVIIDRGSIENMDSKGFGTKC